MFLAHSLSLSSSVSQKKTSKRKILFRGSQGSPKANDNEHCRENRGTSSVYWNTWLGFGEIVEPAESLRSRGNRKPPLPCALRWRRRPSSSQWRRHIRHVTSESSCIQELTWGHSGTLKRCWHQDPELWWSAYYLGFLFLSYLFLLGSCG